MTLPRIAVVGGGVTGLAAAYELRNDADVTIFEASNRLGGKVLTEELDGIQIEAGPDSLLARDDAPLRLLDELGLGAKVVEPHDFGAWIADDGTLKRLPEGFVFGVPAAITAIARSGLLSPRGMARAAADLVLPRRQMDADVSVGYLVRSRFGDEVAERIVAPLMSGVRSGAIDEMSLEMAAPQIASVARAHRSLTLGLRKARRTAAPARFIGLSNGMSSLIDALEHHSGAEIALGATVETVRDDLTIDGRPFDGVVVAVPPPKASALLGIEELGTIRFSSSTVVNLVFAPGSVVLPDSGTGILVTPRSGKSLVASTWFTKKWPHLAPSDGRVVIRCVAAGDPSEETVISEFQALIESKSDPISTRVHRWEAALPEFKVGHRVRMGAATAALRARPIRVAGAGYLVTGINDCLAQGRAAAREVIELARP